MRSCSVGRVYNIACYCHLLWHSSTTTFYPPVGSQCQEVNTCMVYPVKSYIQKVKSFSFSFFCTLLQNNSDIKRCRGQQHRNKNIYVTHDRIKVSTTFHYECVKHWSGGGEKSGAWGKIGQCSHIRKHLCTLGEWELVSVWWSYTVEFQASRPDTVQSRMNGKFGKEQQDWFNHEIKKPLGGSFRIHLASLNCSRKINTCYVWNMSFEIKGYCTLKTFKLPWFLN